MSVENKYLGDTAHTSTRNKYLITKSSFSDLLYSLQDEEGPQVENGVSQAPCQEKLPTDTWLGEKIDPSQRKNILLSVENKLLKSKFSAPQSEGDEMISEMRKVKRKKRRSRSREAKRYRKSCPTAAYADAELLDFPSLSSSDADEDVLCFQGECEPTSGFTFASAPQQLFGLQDGIPVGSAAQSPYGFRCGGAPQQTVGFGFGSPSQPAPGFTFGGAPQQAVGHSGAFEMPRRPMNGGFSFASPKAMCSISNASLRLQSAENDALPYTEFSPTNGMPVYKFESQELVETSKTYFHPLEQDQDILESKRIQNIKQKKSQLLNAMSLALLYSPDFKDKSDTYRIFLSTCAEEVSVIDPEFVLKVALYARQELNIRAASNFLLSHAAFNEYTRPYLEKYLSASIVLPSDWIDVADLYLVFEDENLKNRSLPSALRKAMKKAFEKFDAYQLAKYNQKKKNKAFTLKQLIRALHISSPVEFVMCLLGKKYPKDPEAFRRTGLPGTWNSLMAEKRMKLPVPETWETEISTNGNKPNIWEKLIDDSKLPYMAMLRNLKNLITSGISASHHEKVMKYLGNKKNVLKSRQFPQQFYEAFKMLDNLRISKTENDASGEKSSPELCTKFVPAWKKKQQIKIRERLQNFDIKLLHRYQTAISDAVEISAANNLDPIPGKTVVICDIRCLDKQNKKEAKAYEACVIMSLMCLKSAEDCKVKIIFGEDSMDSIQLSEESFLQNVHNVIQKYEHSDESEDNDDKCLQKLIESYFMPHKQLTQKLDNVIFLNCSPINDRDELKEIISSFLHKYRQLINPELLYTQVDLTLSRRKFREDDNDEDSSAGKDVYLAGFSDHILKFIAARSNGGQLSYIENMDQKYKLNAVSKPSMTKILPENSCEIGTLSSRVPKWHTVRVFISSTFKDMCAERDLIIRYVIPELRSRAMSIFVKINEVDLRWGITEDDCTTKRAAELCLIEAQKSDIFIGLLGERYGTRYDYEAPDHPDLEWVKDYPKESSITELEIHAGALNNPEARRTKAFFYFRNSSFMRRVPPKWQKCFLSEDSDSEMRLKQLKLKIQSNGFKVLNGYPCHWAGDVKDKPLVAGLDDFGHAVLDDLWHAVSTIHENDPFMDEITEEEMRQQEVYDMHSNYVGESNTSIGWLSAETRKRSGVFLIFGAPGCGKTAFMVNFLKKLKNKSVVTFFVGASPRSKDISYVLKHIANAISKKFSTSFLLPKSSEDIKHQFPDILLEAVKYCNYEFTLVIDGLDHFNIDDQHLDWLPFNLPEGMRLICTASDSSVAYKMLSERKACGFPVHFQILSPLQHSDRENFVRNYLKTYGKTLDENAFNNQLLQVVTKKDSGNPLYLRMMCDYLRMFACFENLMTTLQTFPTILHRGLEEIILQMENEYNSVVVQIFLTLLSISEEGLDGADLHLLLSFALKKNDVKNPHFYDTIEELFLFKPEDYVSQITLHSLMHALCTFVYGQSRNRSISLFGTEFKTVVKKFYLNKNYENQAKYLHFILGAYCITICDPKNDQTWQGHSPSAFRGLLYHLFHGMRYKELSEILCSCKFIEAIFQVQGADQLLEYYISILLAVENLSHALRKDISCETLNSYYEFVSRNFHILKSYPHLVYQQAANEPLESLVRRRSVKIGMYGFECLTQSSANDFRLLTMSGFVKNITSVANQPSNSVALFGSENGYLKVFDIMARKVIHSIKGHVSEITSICCAGKSRICTASSDCTLIIWDSHNYTQIAVLKGHRRQITGCCVDHSEKVLVSSGWDCTCRLWSLSDGRDISVIHNFKHPVNCIDHHPHQEEFACGLWDGNIEIWNTVSLEQRQILHGFGGSVKAVVYTPDGVNLISSYINSDVFLWSTRQGLKLASLKGNELPVRNIIYSTLGDIFVTSGEDSTIKVWSNEMKNPLLRFTECKSCPIHFLEISEPNTLAIAFQNNIIWVVDISNGHVISKIDASKDPVTCISKFEIHAKEIRNLIPSSASLIYGTQSGVINIADIKTAAITSISRLDAKITTLIHNRAIIICGTANGDIGVFANCLEEAYNTVVKAHDGSITALSFSNQFGELQILSAATDKVLKLWDITGDFEFNVVENKECVSKHKDYITCCTMHDQVKLASDSKVFITGSPDNNVIAWNENFECILRGLQTSVINVKCNADFVLGCGSDGSIAVWTYDGALIASASGVEQSSAVLAFDVVEGLENQFDVVLAVVEIDGSIVIKKPLQRSFLCSLEGHRNAITSCSIFNGGEILSASLDGSVNVWRIPSEVQDVQLFHDGVVTSVALSSTNDVALSSDIHGNVVLWKIDFHSDSSPLVYASKKTYTGCSVKALLFTKGNACACAVNTLSEGQGKNFLDILGYKVKSDDATSYMFEEQNAYVFSSEISCLDYSDEENIIVVGLLSGEIYIIVSNKKQKMTVAEDWISAVKIDHYAHVVYASIPAGNVFMFDVADVKTNKVKPDTLYLKKVYSSDGPIEAIPYINSLYCDTDQTIYIGDRDGYLRIKSNAEEDTDTKMVHNDCITGICGFGENIFTGSLDRTIKVWKNSTLEQIGQFHSSVPVTCLCAVRMLPRKNLEEDANLLIFGTTSGAVHLLKFQLEE